MNSNVLKGYLGFKGERGYSAYEIAVQNGFTGTEQDWLATLGTSSHFTQSETIYYSETEGQKEFDLPEDYVGTYSFVDVYIEGRRRDSDQYEIDLERRKIVLYIGLDVIGTKVDVVVLTMSTNDLPIVTTISENSTEDTVPSAGCLYRELDVVRSDIRSNFQEVEGSVSGIPVGGSSNKNFEYPDGFTRDNCRIVSVMSEYGENWYYNIDTESTTFGVLGIPIVTNVVFGETNIQVFMKNTSTEAVMTGHFRLVLMKI